MVDHEEASSKVVAGDTKPVRGIDWSAIFQRRPSLSPPGYEQAVAEFKAAKQAKLKEQSAKK